ncbi:translocon-associated protein, alpha subunit [Jimgerdemannia flammicorona]|uniref:Translocon-associated protein, alpha subunit n=1 Tax=Jimgerdemannia flammicorona TaxID=994334 RepID=A0A433QBU1_9FUNG|nr:translocon-associated protein, alpha subunit [Jimgerdemannia flammicorona]
MVKFALVAALLALLVSPLAVSASLPAPNVELTAGFPDSPFGNVVNGQRNKLVVSFSNKDTVSYTVSILSGVLVNPNNFTQIVRNLTALRYDTPIGTGETVDIPFSFHSEIAPQDLGLVVLVDFLDTNGNSHRAVGFNSTVTIVDPPTSIFDLQLLFLYVVLAGVLGGIGYLIQQAFFGGAAKGKKKAKKVVEPSIGAAGAVDEKTTAYDESWIPDGHIKKSPVRQSPRLRNKKQ